MITKIEILPYNAKNYQNLLNITFMEKLDISPAQQLIEVVLTDNRYDKKESLAILVDLADLKKAIEKLHA